MNKRRTLFLFTAILIMVTLVLAGCGGSSNTKQPDETAKSTETVSEQAKPITLKYAFFAPATTFPAKQMEKWKEELEKRTNGKVKVELFPGGTLLTDKNMYDGVRDGVAEIGLSCPTYEPGRFPLLGISDLPSGFTSSKEASRTFFDLVQQFPSDGLKDFKVITAFATEPSYLMSKKPVRSLNDLKGMQIRISGALAPVLKELGATPVGMPMSEVPAALQTGIIEGLVSSREVLKDLKLAESLKNFTEYPMTVTSFVAVMNKGTWDSLPPDVQKVIDELAAEMAAWTGDYMDNHVQTALDWSKKEQGLQVITLSPAEQAAWGAKIKPLQDKYVAELTAKGLPAEDYKKKLYELMPKYSK